MAAEVTAMIEERPFAELALEQGEGLKGDNTGYVILSPENRGEESLRWFMQPGTSPYKRLKWRSRAVLKEMLLIKRKEGLSKEEFIRHYEGVHAPLILKMCPWVKKYVRNYVHNALAGGEPDFDCITEVWYEDKAGFQAMAALYGSEEGKVIRDGEASFFDQSSMVVMFVDEKVSG